MDASPLLPSSPMEQNSSPMGTCFQNDQPIPSPVAGAIIGCEVFSPGESSVMSIGEAGGEQQQQQGSPMAVIDEASLHDAMDRNKESLKKKLLVRRPLEQLVQQGILPALKSSASFHEHRQKLERAKMGDILKHKIASRPDRDSLIAAHILEDTSVDPSLQDRQRQLKKQRLVDDLNGRLALRPGPLELVQGNILHVGKAQFDQAVKDGKIMFKRTSEGDTPRQHVVISPITTSSCESSPVNQDEFSAQSPLIFSPINDSTMTSVRVPEYTTAVWDFKPTKTCFTPSDAASVVQSSSTAPAITSPFVLTFSTAAVGSKPTATVLPQTVAVVTPASIVCANPTVKNGTISSQQAVVGTTTAGSGSSSKKKAKSNNSSSSAPAQMVPQQKQRIIKFHEYKGPPASQKQQQHSNASNNNSNNNNVNNTNKANNSNLSRADEISAHESAYELLLQQQQLFLQLQLQQQSAGTETTAPRMILPAAPASPSANCDPTATPITLSSAAFSTHTTLRLEDMKVSALKNELKQRSLPVSGTKNQLIERLRAAISVSNVNNNNNITSTGNGGGGDVKTPVEVVNAFKSGDIGTVVFHTTALPSNNSVRAGSPATATAFSVEKQLKQLQQHILEQQLQRQQQQQESLLNNNNAAAQLETNVVSPPAVSEKNATSSPTPAAPSVTTNGEETQWRQRLQQQIQQKLIRQQHLLNQNNAAGAAGSADPDAALPSTTVIVDAESTNKQSTSVGKDHIVLSTPTANAPRGAKAPKKCMTSVSAIPVSPSAKVKIEPLASDAEQRIAPLPLIDASKEDTNKYFEDILDIIGKNGGDDLGEMVMPGVDEGLLSHFNFHLDDDSATNYAMGLSQQEPTSSAQMMTVPSTTTSSTAATTSSSFPVENNGVGSFSLGNNNNDDVSGGGGNNHIPVDLEEWLNSSSTSDNMTLNNDNNNSTLNGGGSTVKKSRCSDPLLSGVVITNNEIVADTNNNNSDANNAIILNHNSANNGGILGGFGVSTSFEALLLAEEDDNSTSAMDDCDMGGDGFKFQNDLLLGQIWEQMDFSAS